MIVNCYDNLRALARTGAHELSWQTSDVDPGTNRTGISVSGDTLLEWSQSESVTARRITDGQRLWQVLNPSGAGTVRDVVVSGSTAVVLYDDRLRGLNLATGAQTWVVSGMVAGTIVASADGWVYANKDLGVALQRGNGCPRVGRASIDRHLRHRRRGRGHGVRVARGRRLRPAVAVHPPGAAARGRVDKMDV
ncbi:MAG: hypothetical protein V9G19_02035 [Tetrasphaera sp.]